MNIKTNKRSIPNPNKITQIEKDFISTKLSEKKPEILEKERKEIYKGRMISMSDSFYNQLNVYLKNNPTEGNRSSFIVRAVAEYIANKQ